MTKKVIVAMSGGVDSSVAARLLVDAGYTCMGVTMKLTSGEIDGTCCSTDDVEDARCVARTLGIPYHVFNFSDRFDEAVIDKFIDAYEHGRTPNPCIDCNRYLKFDKLYDRARVLGYDAVATGHYAKVDFDAASGRYLLKKAADETKDQSYVLYTLGQEQLSHTLFPLGDMKKSETRALAERYGFINANKHDSQDICFVPSGHYADFIRSRTGKDYPEGDFVDESGRPLGRHKGIIAYTVGQRRGLGVAAGEPLYVKAVNPEKNTVTLAGEKALYSKVIRAKDINFIAVDGITRPMRVMAKVRYRQKEQKATVLQTGDDELTVTFDEAQRAPTAGQAVVLYDGDVVIGGGTIC